MYIWLLTKVCYAACGVHDHMCVCVTYVHACMFLYALCVMHIEMSTAHVMRNAQDGEHQVMKARMEAALRECEQAREVRQVQACAPLGCA